MEIVQKVIPCAPDYGGGEGKGAGGGTGIDIRVLSHRLLTSLFSLQVERCSLGLLPVHITLSFLCLFFFLSLLHCFSTLLHSLCLALRRAGGQEYLPDT